MISRQARFLGCGLLMSLASALTQADDAASAQVARLDWVPFSQLTQEQQAQTRRVCGGAYIHPEPSSTGLPDNEVTAREARYDADGGVILEGDVRAVTPQGFLQAERATISPDRSRVQAEGAVSIRQPSGLMLGRSGVLNNQAGTFDLQQADYLIFQNHFRGQANRIRRTEDGIVIIDEGSYTSCSPDDNSWQLVGAEIKLDSESGFGTARHARLELSDIPVFYWPYLKFPIDDRRHTGLLMPTLGLGTDGVEEYKQPLYLNLAPNYDATLTPHWYRDRGTHMGTEWRYLLPENHYGMLTYDFMNSDPLAADQKRSFFAYEARGQLAPRWIYRIDYGKASDDHYFRDFEANFSDANTEKLDQLAETLYQQGNWQYIARLQGFQELNANLTDANREYYKLPELQANYADRRENLSWGSRHQAVWFTREVEDGSTPSKNTRWGADMEAQRAHLEPHVSYRASKLWGFSQLDVRAAYSQYQLSGQTAGMAESEQRLIPTLALDSGLFFERDLKTFGQGYIQTLEPRMKLVYSPTEDQYDIPVFDTSEYSFDRNQLFRDSRFSGVDRQGDLQKLALGVTSRFINEDSGREILNLSVGQAFYAQERTVSLSTDPAYQPDYQHSRLISPLVASAGYYPLDWLTLDLDTQWNTDRSGFLLEKRETKLTATHDSGMAFMLRHKKSYTGCALRFDCADNQARPYDETADFGIIAPVNDRWKAFAVLRRDMVADEFPERIAGLEYDSCCWSVRIAKHMYYTGENYSNPDAFNNKFSIDLLLKGFGGLGDEEPYERAAEFIPGFRSAY